MTGPLTGISVIELGGIGPTPFAGMMLADLGATVTRVDRPERAGQLGHPVLTRGKRSITADLKNPDDVAAIRQLVQDADVLIEGFRPGVAERLGLGPEDLAAVNPRLVYGRMTGWGQDGPLAAEPGHDINYIAVAGVLGTMGEPDREPTVPLNLIGDFGGGAMFLALGVVSAVLEARTSGQGQIVDAAMVDGAGMLMAMQYGFLAQGRWQDRRGVNILDGAAPFYRTYRTSDDGFMAVGCVEPQFWEAMLGTLELTDDPVLAAQNDQAQWPAMSARLAEVFAARARAEWTETFAGVPACVTPVLSMREAADHPLSTERGAHLPLADGHVQPAPAPRFSRTALQDDRTPPVIGSDNDLVRLPS